MQKVFKVVRFLLAIEVMRRGWRRLRPLRFIKLATVLVVGIGALVIIAVALKRLRHDEGASPTASNALDSRPPIRPTQNDRRNSVPALSASSDTMAIRRSEPGTEKIVLEPSISKDSESVAEPTEGLETDSIGPDQTGNCPKSHPIKGVSRSGIYHTPESRWYERAKADVCFTSIEAAEAAGFRAPGKTPKTPR